MKEYDVLIIGGGITGVGIARDCAMRGLKTLLVERQDLTNGATGRNHGLLHSGARYAVTDPESAAECIRENRILRRIASNCVEPTGGLFVSLPDDDAQYRALFMKACHTAGISAEEIDPAEALRLEPALNREVTAAIRVPDASIDPFRLATANAVDARLHGAMVLTYHEVVQLLQENGAIVGAVLRQSDTGEVVTVRAAVTVNAAGVWGQKVAMMADVPLTLLPSKGSLLIFGHRVARMTLNRCRKPASADILVPGDVVSVLGTTSKRVSIDECDNIRVTPGEVDELLREGCALAPMLAQTRVLRAYAGVRPLYTASGDGTGRDVSRGITIIDHEVRDGLHGFITATGGKLTTYRLMAEEVTDLVCQKLKIRRKCRTADKSLPGSEKDFFPAEGSLSKKAAAMRHGTKAQDMDFDCKSEVLCGCEHVTRAEIAYAVKTLGVHNLVELRRRTRVGMGTCQGSFCMGKVAAALAEEMGCPDEADTLVAQYVQERWKGIAPVCWGESLREAEYMRKLYKK